MSWLKSVFPGKTRREPVNINDSNFNAEVSRFRGALLLDVWGPNCQPCNQLAPVMMDLATEYHGKVKVAELNAADAPRSVRSLSVRGTPTTVVYKDGAEIGRIVGFKPKSFWKQLIETEFGDHLSGEALAATTATESPSPAPATDGRKLTSKAAKKAAKRARHRG